MSEFSMDNLRALIAQRRVSLRLMAARSGVPYHTLTKIAQGRVSPRMATAEKLYAYFLGDTQNTAPAAAAVPNPEDGCPGPSVALSAPAPIAEPAREEAA